MNILFAETVDELCSLRTRHPQAALMAGGTDLLVKIAHKHLQPETIICLEHCAELKEIQENTGELKVGAAVSMQMLMDRKIVIGRLPLLRSALTVLGSPPVRHVATLGGNLCTASPAGDSIPALQLLDARVELCSASEKRQIPVADFITGPGRTSLKNDEILSSIIIPLDRDEMRSGFFKIGHRKALAIAVASLAALWQTDERGLVKDIRLAWGSVGPRIMRFPEIEERLIGKRLNEQTVKEARQMLCERVAPIDDLRATASYRREAAGNLLFKLLE